jgi:hypothetical protein
MERKTIDRRCLATLTDTYHAGSDGLYVSWTSSPIVRDVSSTFSMKFRRRSVRYMSGP